MKKRFRRKFLYGLMVFLFLLHHDSFFWNETTSAAGLPLGLWYDVIYSLAAAGLWALVVFYAWPEEIEVMAQGSQEGEGVLEDSFEEGE